MQLLTQPMLLLTCFATNVAMGKEAPETCDENCFVLAANGTQNYKCNTTNSEWFLDGPEAILFFAKDETTKVGDHNFMPIADANGGRATWFDDDSSVTVKLIKNIKSPDGATNIDWLLTEQTSGKGDVGSTFGNVKYVVRVNTGAGVAPSNELCQTEGEINEVFYTADYWVLESDSQTFSAWESFFKVNRC